MLVTQCTIRSCLPTTLYDYRVVLCTDIMRRELVLPLFDEKWRHFGDTHVQSGLALPTTLCGRTSCCHRKTLSKVQNFSEICKVHTEMKAHLGNSCKRLKTLRKVQKEKKESKRRGHLDPETRTNLRDEFMQGTNIFMHALRGVGVWKIMRRAWPVVTAEQESWALWGVLYFKTSGWDQKVRVQS